MQPTNCLNCGSNLNTYKFCPVCGQKAATHRLSFHDLWHELLHYFTHADKNIFSLVGALAVRPGVVAREFVEGRRAKYFKPVNFFLLVGGILVFMTSYFHLTNETYLHQMEQAAAHASDPVLKERLAGIAVRMGQMDHYIDKYSNVVNMLATPLFAFIYWLFYKRARYSYIEHLVGNMYFVSFSMLCYSLLVVPWQSKLMATGSTWILMGIYFVLEIGYRSFAYYRFINRKGAGAYLKALSISLLTTLFWIALSYSLIQQYIMTGFK